MSTDLWVEIPAGSGGGGGGSPTGPAGGDLGGSYPNPDVPLLHQASNTVAGFDGSGNLESIPGWTIDVASGGFFEFLSAQPNDMGGGFNGNLFNIDFDPLQASPDDDWNIQAINAHFDVNNSGFPQGTSGEAATLLNLYAENVHSGSLGAVQHIKSYFQMGNGTDPFTLKGFSYHLGFGDFNDNVTIDGGIQGYSFQPHIHSGAIITSNYGVNAFADFSNVEIPTRSHTSFQASPSFANVETNNNYAGVNINPTITALTGNAGFGGVGIFGNIGTMSATGNINGFVFSPNITTSHGSIAGLQINPNVTGGDANFTGVQINPNGGANFNQATALSINLGNITSNDPQGVTGISSDSRLQINATTTLASSQTFQIGSRIENLFHIPSGSPVTGTDSIGINAAGDLSAEDNLAVGPIGLGFNSVGFIASMGVAVGKTVDTVNVFLPASSLPDPGYTTGGTITNMSIIRTFPPLSQGGTATITNLYGLKIDNLFGPFSGVATNSWGLFIEDAALGNYIGGNIAIGTASTKVTNASVALEIGGTTKAVRFPNMTTTQKLALTALAGMQVFDTTLNQMSYYNGTVWVNF